MAAGQATGIDAYVEIEYGGSSFNISGDGNRATLNETGEAPEKTGYQPTGSTRQRSTGGLKDWSFSMDVFWNDDDSAGSTGKGIDTLAASVLDQQVVLTFGPAGSTAGYRKNSGSGIVTTFSTESPVEGMITGTVEIVASSGSLTKTTF